MRRLRLIAPGMPYARSFTTCSLTLTVRFARWCSHRSTGLSGVARCRRSYGDVRCMKLFYRTPGTAGAYFLACYFSALNLYKSAFPELSFLCCSLHFADCLTEDNNSVPVCLSTVVVDSQRKASKRLFTLT